MRRVVPSGLYPCFIRADPWLNLKRIGSRLALRVGQVLAAPADDEELALLIAVPVDGDAGVGAPGADGDVVLAQDGLALVGKSILVAELAARRRRDELAVVEAPGL